MTSGSENPCPQIRRARPGEAQILTRIALASKRANGYSEAFMRQCTDELTMSEHDIANQLIWVADNPQAAGFGALVPATPGATGEVQSMFIAPDHMGHGLGRALWQTIEAHARTLGLTALELDADPFAVKFYNAMGATTTGQSPSGSIPGRMLPRMRKAL